ncbi:MAG: hypothetical protein SOW44_07200 [Porphyromonas sp.]|nr:hypothetical protein [Porphyromonas sp.]
MKSLPLRQAEKTLLSAATSSVERRVCAYTFKKDRFISLQVMSDGMIIVEEYGFRKETSAYPATDKGAIKKALKEAFAREFPRSHRIYCEEQ